MALPRVEGQDGEVIRAGRGKIPIVILRIAGVYDDLCHSIPLAQQMQRIYEHDITAYLFPGDVSGGRQAFVHNEDVIDAILLAVARRRDLPAEVTLLTGEPAIISARDPGTRAGGAGHFRIASFSSSGDHY